jgi:hypothetical protein
MVKEMRRTFTLSAVFGLIVAGLGCHHVAGKCDCTYNPANFPLPTPNQPFAQIGSPIVGLPANAAPEPSPMEKLPPAKDLPNGK